MTINERVKHMIEALGLNGNTFSIAAGINPSVLNHILNGRNAPSYGMLKKMVLPFDNINVEWLITGKGDVFKPKAEINKNGVPLIASEAAAGFGTAHFSINESNIQERYIIPDFIDVDFMIRVKGDSMYPKYSSGDIIACRIIRDSKFIQWNKCYVIATKEQGLLVKRVKEGQTKDLLTMVSENAEYNPFEVPINEITGFALIVGAVRLE